MPKNGRELRITDRVLDVLVSHEFGVADELNRSIFSGWRDQTQDHFYCCSRTVRIANCS